MIRISRTKDVKMPTRGTGHSAGLDFYIPNNFRETWLPPGTRINIPSGIHIDFLGSNLEDHALVFFNKSGVATKKGLIIGACVVDADYQGEVHLNVINTNENESVQLLPGDKIVQGLLLKVNYAEPVEVPFDELYAAETERGAGGFGSTGDK